MSWLLDTNILSELGKPQPNPSVLAWFEANADDEAYLSVLTIGEIKGGIHALPPSKKRDKLTAWFETEILVEYKNRILPIDTETMLHWGEMRAELARKGRIIPVIDSLLASSVHQHRLTLVTRNEKDFIGLDIDVVNPWNDAP